MTIPKKLEQKLEKELEKACQGIEKACQGTCPAFEIAKRIISLRDDLNNIKGLVNDMLKLAIDDLTIHHNKTSLFSCVFLQDNKKRTLYNCYNIKDYLKEIGIVLSYNVKKDEKDIYFDLEKWEQVKDNVPPYLTILEKLDKARKEQRKVLTKYEQVKEKIKDLSNDEKELLMAFLKGQVK